MSSTVAPNSGFSEQDLNERIDVGIAFLVLLFMAGLGAYLMMDGDSEGASGAFLAADNAANDTSSQRVVAAPVESVVREDDDRRDRREQIEPQQAVVEQAAPAEVMQPAEAVELPEPEPVQALQAEPRPFQPVEVVPAQVEPEVVEEVIEEIVEVEPVEVEPLPAEPEPAAEMSDDELAILQDATSKVSFLTASAVLTEESNAVLDKIVGLMKGRSGTRLSIIGFTDSQGDSDRNVALSFARAEACRDYLLERGIEIGRVDSVGMGSRRPIGDNATPEGRKLNRRVEFTLLQSR